MNIKRYIRHNSEEIITLRKLHNGGERMAVSIVNTVPIVKGVDADRLMKEIRNNSNNSNDFFSKCTEMSNRLRKGHINR